MTEFAKIGKGDSTNVAEKDYYNARVGGVPHGSVPSIREAAERTERLLREFKYEAARCFNIS